MVIQVLSYRYETDMRGGEERLPKWCETWVLKVQIAPAPVLESQPALPEGLPYTGPHDCIGQFLATDQSIYHIYLILCFSPSGRVLTDTNIKPVSTVDN